MATRDEINKAIGAHGMWKTRLSQAIETGRTDMSVDAVRVDNQCAFGKWLYGSTLNEQDKNSVHYREVRALHAEFHKTAAKVLEYAMAGKKQEALQLMAIEGDFAKISSKLTASMSAWSKGLAA
ncbi:MAG: CZB domain-containing protein [Nitrospira sp.]|nr:CZB domain-containing protein [Nitrospira sp.]